MLQDFLGAPRAPIVSHEPCTTLDEFLEKLRLETPLALRPCLVGDVVPKRRKYNDVFEFSFSAQVREHL